MFQPWMISVSLATLFRMYVSALNDQYIPCYPVFLPWMVSIALATLCWMYVSALDDQCISSYPVQDVCFSPE